MLIRILIAVVACVLAYALIGPVSRLIGFEVSGDILTVFKVVVAGCAVFYIIRGPNWPSWTRA